jgi:hypothetical protein
MTLLGLSGPVDLHQVLCPCSVGWASHQASRQPEVLRQGSSQIHCKSAGDVSGVTTGACLTISCHVLCLTMSTGC